MKKNKCDDAVTYSDIWYATKRILLGAFVASVLIGTYKLGNSDGFLTGRSIGYAEGNAFATELYKNDYTNGVNHGLYAGCDKAKDKYFKQSDPRWNDGFCNSLIGEW